MKMITEGRNNMEDKEKSGKPWKIIFKSRIFSEADMERKNFLAQNEDYQVKVKYLSSNDCFVVKVRQIGEKNKKQ